MERQTHTIKEVTAMWAFTHRPNDMSGRFQIDLCGLEKADVDALTKMGITIKTKDDRGDYITVKSAFPMKIIGEDGELMTADVHIGNGSKMKVMIGTYAWEFKGKKGVSPSLVKAKMTKLVEYHSSVDFEDEVDSKVKSGKIEDMADDIPF